MAALNVRRELITAKTADETTSGHVRIVGMSKVKIYTTSVGTISSGAVTIEEADIDPADDAAGYTGTWSALGSAITPVTDSQVGTVITASAFSCVRARISTAIGGGGTVTVVLVATE